MNSRTATRAFTLIEMLVALAITGVIFTMVYGSYAATTRSVDVYSRRMTCSERAQLVLRLMTRQLRCAYLPVVQADETDPFGLPPRETGTSPPVPPAASALFRGDPCEPRGEILSLATTGGLSVDANRPGGLSRIRYRYDTQSGVLAIACEPYVQALDSRHDAPTWQRVLDGVTDVELSFYDGRQWQPRWNSRRAGGLPQAVRLALTIVDESGRMHHYATAAPIACRSTVLQQQRNAPVEQP